VRSINNFDGQLQEKTSDNILGRVPISRPLTFKLEGV